MAQAPEARYVWLRRMGRRTAEALWQVAEGDPAWPLRQRTRDAWWSLVERLWAAEVVGEGAMRAVWTEGQVLLGFVNACVVPAEVADIPGGGVECGTYLVPQARGQGWNSVVKQAWLHHVWSRWPVQFALFTIPARNEAAQRAFAKLGWPARVSAAPEADVSAATTISGRGAAPAWLARLARRRAWEIGEPCVVYAIERDTLGP